jgi:hypothetical protein
MAEQWVLWRNFRKYGKPVAAFPLPTAPHIRLGKQAHAIDVNSLDGGENRLQRFLEHAGADGHEPGARRGVAHGGARVDAAPLLAARASAPEEGRSLMTKFSAKVSLALWQRRLAYREKRHAYWHRRHDAKHAAHWHHLVEQAQAMIAKRKAQLEPFKPLEGLDWAWGHANITELKRAGIHFACRYLSHDASKNLTHAEATALSKAGIWCVVVWETTANRAGAGRQAGTADAIVAAEQAKACGKPGSAPIYFAVDFDADPARVQRVLPRRQQRDRR